MFQFPIANYVETNVGLPFLYEERSSAMPVPPNLPLNPETKTRKYYPVPHVMPGVIEYQNVNADPRLRKNVTEFYIYKINKWIQSDNDFTKYKKLANHFKSQEGTNTVYNLLKEFVKKSGINWYDIRDNYQLVKDYFKYKLMNL
jgi:hypothetical protein